VDKKRFFQLLAGLIIVTLMVWLIVWVVNKDLDY